MAIPLNNNSTSSLTFRHISVASDEILNYINDRRLGVVKSLRTRWDKFNNSCNGGVEPNSIYTIAGISGSGDKVFINTHVTYQYYITYNN